MNGSGLIFKLKTEQETKTMNCDYLVFQTLPQIRLYSLHIRQHAIVFDRLKSCSDRSHCQHSTAKGCSQIVLLDLRRYRFLHQTSGNRDAAAQSLCQCDDVRHNAVSRFASRKEPLPCAPDASLHFVVNQNDAAFVAQLRVMNDRNLHGPCARRPSTGLVRA